VRWCRTDAGDAALSGVVSKTKTDRMESYVLAETFKYYYLLFAPQAIDSDAVMFNTEAHPLRAPAAKPERLRPMSDTIDPRETAAPHNKRARRALIAEISSLFALAVSFLALGLGIWQARLMSEQTRVMQQQARAGVWPYLSIGYALVADGERRGYTWRIDNDGVGPARIESVTLTLDGKPLEHWKDVFRALYGDAPVQATYSQIYGKVLPPSTNRETTIEAVHIADPGQAKTFFEAQSRLEMSICYCSVYDDCWIAHRQSPVVQQVERCETRGIVQFEPSL
jgi:hypothetical protein